MFLRVFYFNILLWNKIGIKTNTWGGIAEKSFSLHKKYALENYIELLKLILPEILIEHFDVIKAEKKSDQLHLYFEEKNKIPSEYAKRQLISKGFHSEITIQDFPLRGKFVFLHVKRRRWTDKVTNEIIQRDWKEVAEGTRLTHEFASFLKEINRY